MCIYKNYYHLQAIFKGKIEKQQNFHPFIRTPTLKPPNHPRNYPIDRIVSSWTSIEYLILAGHDWTGLVTVAAEVAQVVRGAALEAAVLVQQILDTFLPDRLRLLGTALRPVAELVRSVVVERRRGLVVFGFSLPRINFLREGKF